MLERHQEAPDSLPTANKTDWARLRDSPLVGLNGIIDWNQIERERLLGVAPEYSWNEDDEDDSENEPSEDEDNEDWVHEYILDEEFDVIEWIADEIEEEFMEMMAVDQ